MKNNSELEQDGLVQMKKYPTSKRKHDEDYNQSAAKRQCNEIDDDELEKMLEEITVEYDRKIALGKRVYKILERGKVLEVVLPKDMQDALDIYRRNLEQVNEKEKELEFEEENDIEPEEEKELEESEDDKQSEDEKEISEESEIDENDKENEKVINPKHTGIFLQLNLPGYWNFPGQ